MRLKFFKTNYATFKEAIHTEFLVDRLSSLIRRIRGVSPLSDSEKELRIIYLGMVDHIPK